MAAGHQGRRLRLQPGRRRLQRLRQPGRLQRHRRRPRRLGVRPRTELHRRDRRPVGRATATNQNAWIDAMKKTLQDPSTRASSSSTSSTATTTRRSQHAPRRRPCSQRTRTSRSSSPRPRSASWRPPRSSSAPEQVGHGQGHRPRLPDGMESLRQGRRLAGVRRSGTCRTSATSPTHVADELVKRRRSPAAGRDLHRHGLNGGQPYTIGEDSVVVLGPPSLQQGQHRPVL